MKSKKIHLRIKLESGKGTLCNPNLIDVDRYTIEEFEKAIRNYPSEVCKKCRKEHESKSN